MSTITDRIEIQLDAGSDEVTLTRAEAVEVATRLHRQAAEPGRCSCGADAYCTDYLSNGFHRYTVCTCGATTLCPDVAATGKHKQAS